jgi:hypothetical protein
MLAKIGTGRRLAGQKAMGVLLGLGAGIRRKGNCGGKGQGAPWGR